VQLSYIKDLAKAYVIDNRLYEGKNIITEDELAENFYNAIKTLRSDHLTFYQSFLESNKFEQQKIFKTYFDLYFETDRSLEPLNEGFITMSLLALYNLLSQPYLLFIFVLLIGPATLSSRFSKNTWKFITYLLTKIGNMGKWFSKVGDSGRISYSILFNNSQRCLKRCNYDPNKDPKMQHLLYQMKQGSSFRVLGKIFMGIRSEENLKCLRECYLEHIQETVKLAVNMYFQCLQNTGDLSRMPLERDFSSFQKIIVKTQLNQSCESFMKVVSETLKIFDGTIKLIYAEEKSKRVTERVKLMNDIYKIQKDMKPLVNYKKDQRFSQNNNSSKRRY
jgi:hypothetical protein